MDEATEASYYGLCEFQEWAMLGRPRLHCQTEKDGLWMSDGSMILRMYPGQEADDGYSRPIPSSVIESYMSARRLPAKQRPELKQGDRIVIEADGRKLCFQARYAPVFGRAKSLAALHFGDNSRFLPVACFSGAGEMIAAVMPTTEEVEDGSN